LASSFFRKNLLFLLSLLLLVCSYGIWVILSSQEPGNRSSLKTISSNVQAQIIVAQEEANQIRKIIEETDIPAFPSLQKKTKFEYFVFRNKWIYFWSDNHFAPAYEVLEGGSDLKFVSLRSGKYLVCKSRIQKKGDWFEIFSFIPLSNEYSIENNYISSSLNEEIFENLPVRIAGSRLKDELSIFSDKNEYLFSVELLTNAPVLSRSILWMLLVTSLTGIVLLLVYVFRKIILLEHKNKRLRTLSLLLLVLLCIRIILLKIKYPFVLIEFDLFNSKYFASSSLAPSMGDFLLNSIVVFAFVLFLFRSYTDFTIVKGIFRLSEIHKTFISVLIILLGSISVFLFYYAMHTLFEHAQLDSDITVNIDMGYLRIAEYLIFILLFITFFLFNHVLYRIFINLNHKKSYGTLAIYFLFGNLIFLALAFILSPSLVLLPVCNFVYVFILIYLRLPHTLARLKYLTYVYFLNTAFMCSFLSAFAIYEVNSKVSLIEKQRFASQLLTDNDPLAEYLLNEASRQIREDVFIQKRILDPFVSKDIIEQKIRRIFLGNYFDKYETDVQVFDANGNPFYKNSEFFNYQQAKDAFLKDAYRTDYGTIFFLNNPEKNNEKKYVSLISIVTDGQLTGHILIQIKQGREASTSVYPKLLVDREFLSPFQARDYSYGIFNNDKLVYAAGSYNYERYFPSSLFQKKEIFLEGLSVNGYNHIGVQGQKGKRVVVSSLIYPISDVFSNFSFLFLILILFTLLFIISYALYFRFRKVNTNFSTKIQIYLNIAFFLPLLIVSITTLSIITISYRNNLNESFIAKAQSISNNISFHFESYLRGDMQKEKFEKNLLQIAHYTESDINLFSSRGRLLFTNQNMIYEAGLLSKFINPEAYATLLHDKFSNYMLTESVGTLRYNVAYIGIKSSETGDLIGILSIPFFESKHAIDRQVIEVLTTTINIFITIFIVFLVLSYFASHMLTVPLKIITEKINRISLNKNNEPIEWNSKDEIGLMVDEYNKMLLKLEESKVALAKSEKESAWREMAKQVAHEIKNPLTPMKLTIQHLQRTLMEKSGNIKLLTEKALDTLLDQVNNLSEIATSFSTFAKMPIPKYQRFDVSSVLANAVNLYSNTEDVDINCDIKDENYFVMGDEQLMTSIFTNLILNGIQSVPNSRKAQISASVKKLNSSILIEIKDNGTGIPENIRDKVFIPNFSTKFAGSGIGLAVAKRGVEHAGGRIWFETIEGEGTSFFVELPLIIQAD
jgi:two-component system, NtrC family, nitrogen regulation sensor histidine kinase NtrY